MKITASIPQSQIFDKIWRADFVWNDYLRQKRPFDGPTHTILGSDDYHKNLGFLERLRPSLPINQELRDRIAIYALKPDQEISVTTQKSHVMAFNLQNGQIHTQNDDSNILSYNATIYMPPSTDTHRFWSPMHSIVMLINMADAKEFADNPKALSLDIYDSMKWKERSGKEALISEPSEVFGFTEDFKTSPWANGKLKFLFFDKGQEIAYHRHPKQNLFKVNLSSEISYQNQNEHLRGGDCAIVRDNTAYHGKAEGASRMLLFDLTKDPNP